MFKSDGVHKGFTLIEILLVVAAIAILASIVIIAINPTKQLGDTRNAARRVDVKTIIDGVYQYAVDNNGAVPASITNVVTNVCRTGAVQCPGLIDLTALTNSEEYLTAIPKDPSTATNIDTGYSIVRDAFNRITVAAPGAEQGATITVTR